LGNFVVARTLHTSRNQSIAKLVLITSSAAKSTTAGRAPHRATDLIDGQRALNKHDHMGLIHCRQFTFAQVPDYQDG